MRILMFSSYFPPQYSGAAKQAISLARELRTLGCHIEFATMHDSGLPFYEVYNGFPVHRIRVDGRRNQEFPFWPNFFRFALKHRHRFDVLHSHGAHYINSVIGPIAKMMGWKSLVKSTMSNNDMNGVKKSASGKLHYLFLKMVDVYIAISSDLISEFSGYGFRQDRIYHIPNGVDTVRFRPADKSQKKDLRRRLNLPGGRIILLSVGVFDLRKNIGWLIKEWADNKGFGTDYFLLAIGPQSREDKDGSFLSSLKEIVAGNKQNMMLLDHVDNIEEYYRASDRFILSSKNEGLPNVILEAMASGLPCVATRAKGTSDLISDGLTGFLFEQNDKDQFSKMLKKKSDSEFRDMGLNARQFALEKFSITAIADRYFELYNEMLRSMNRQVRQGIVRPGIRFPIKSPREKE